MSKYTEKDRVRNRERYKSDPEYRARCVADARAYVERRNPSEHLHATAKTRAKRAGREFNIEVSDVIVPEFCPVLGMKLQRAEGRSFRSKDASPSLDRIDSSKGYVKGNIRVISWRANIVKGDATMAEIEAVVAYMRGEL